MENTRKLKQMSLDQLKDKHIGKIGTTARDKYESDLMNEILNSISPKEAKKIERNMILAADIADEMELKGYDNEDLAKILKEDVGKIEKWLSGTYNFTKKEIQKIKLAIRKCKSHKSKTMSYVEWHEWAEKKMKHGAKQKRCSECGHWFFKEEFGKGWYKKSNISYDKNRETRDYS